ncbi:MAG TPA: methyltransferase domain-containing protein [Fluviicoccus sp.]|nr:methyltransferase domain-containing protein [Fluviicoccus sp.]
MSDKLLTRVFRALAGSPQTQPSAPVLTAAHAVLNVGGNSKSIPLPEIYQGWDQIWLDIDPAVKPDVLCDARELLNTPPAVYDAVLCSHNLEHYYPHDARRVLAGFKHVLKPGGFAHILVPDVNQVLRRMLEQQLDIEDVLYQSEAGPITVHDVLYGFGKQIEKTGNDFFAHKAGFTPKSLYALLQSVGFKHIYIGCGDLEIIAYAFMDIPSPDFKELLSLPAA